MDETTTKHYQEADASETTLPPYTDYTRYTGIVTFRQKSY